MKNPTIILVNEMKAHFESIMDVIESQNLTSEVYYAQEIEEAIEMIPEKGTCLIVTESCVPSEKNLKEAEGVKVLLREGKKKNSECKFLLYSLDPRDLNLGEFESYIDSADEESLGNLLTVIAKFCGKQLR